MLLLQYTLRTLEMAGLCGRTPSILQQLAVRRPEPMPVVDLSHLNQNFGGRSLVIKDIGTACRKFGCLQVINHGIDTSVMKDALEAASEFFEMSTEAKQEFASDDIQKPVRYDTSPKDGISKARAFLKHYAHPLSDWLHFWPLDPPGYRERMGKYAIESRRVALQLMNAILESLGLGQAYLNDKLDEGMQLLGVNYYPKSSQPDGLLGLAPHSDYGFLTILLQNCQGLHVMDHDTETWREVSHVPDTLHVNIGDYLEVLSNGLYRSVVHKTVLSPDKKRISIVSIHGLSMDEKVAVAKELLDVQRPKKYKESSFRDFLNYLSTKVRKERSFLETLKIDGT